MQNHILDSVKKATFIINPTSGVLKKEKIGDLIKSRLNKQLFHPEIFYTEGPGHATEISQQEVHQGSDVVVAVGGDGTVNEVAIGLTGSETHLGIIPAGSGNGLAHHLKIPVLWRHAIDVINRDKVRVIDTGKINDQLFVSIAGIGFDGLIAKRFEKSKLRGFVSYLKLVAESYSSYKPKSYRIEINGEIIKTKALFIVFANSDQFGFKTPIAPNARVDDGKLDVVIAQKPQIIELPYLASLLYWRKIELSRHITSYQTDCIKISSRRNRWVNLDGNPIKLGKELNIRILPGSLKVIVP